MKDPSMKILYWYYLFVTCLGSMVVISCGDSYEKRADDIVRKYGQHNHSLATLLDYYKKGTDRYNAATFILANLPPNFSTVGQDIESSTVIRDYRIVNSDSIVWSIEQAFNTWDKVPWKGLYSCKDFLEYVLPYRIYKEPLEYYWREDARKRYNVQGENMLEIAQHINDAIEYINDLPASQPYLQSYSSILHNKPDGCDDRAVLVAMAMRAHGIPAAYDFIPQWGGTHLGHSICAVIMPDGRSVGFHSPNDNGQNLFFTHKPTKIYRSMYSLQKNTILYEMKNTEPIPPFFAKFDIKDVTSTHSISFANMRTEIPAEATDNKIVYLGVFSISGWNPIAYTANKGPETIFAAVGTGQDAKGNENFQGENIGRGILYMPCMYDKSMIPIAKPVIHSFEGERIIFADTLRVEQVVLKRKYPRLQRIVSFAEKMIGGVFEGANCSDFSDAVEMHCISSTPLSHMQRVELHSSQSFRYVRYRMPRGTFSLGEIKLFGKDGHELQGKIISYDIFADDDAIGNIADGDPLTYFWVTGMFDAWAGLDLGKSVLISAFKFCPRTDDNDISPGDTYELFWWNNASVSSTKRPIGWTSLDRQEATDYELVFDNVPTGALLWLRNLTRGREERPFTYENGKQIWW